MKSNCNVSYIEAVNLALDYILSTNKRSACIGLGINDPKRIFSTTKNLVEKFGESRVIEPPTSENALTGITFGMCIRGYSVCLIHQRFDFALLSFDQIINTISKWKFMFGKKDLKASCLIRLIVGRGWGQGPTHSQSYHSFLASLPGLKVLYPFDPDSVYKSITYGMNSGQPTIIIEHRWLHQSVGSIMKDFSYNKYISSIIQLKKGSSFTIFTYGYMVPEALKAIEILEAENISIDLFITVDISDFSCKDIIKSVIKNKYLMLIDCYSSKCSIVNDVATKIFSNEECRKEIKSFQILSLEEGNESTSYFNTKNRYKTHKDIVNRILSSLNKKTKEFHEETHHDIPGEWFKGPF